jgi:sugar diacid utilization regulator
MDIHDLMKESGCSTIEEYAEVRRIKDGITELMTMATNGMGFGPVVNEIANLLAVPVSVTDSSLSFIAMSDSFIEVFFPYYEEYKSGYLPDDAQRLLKSMNLIDPETRNMATTVFQWKAPDGSVHTNHHSMIFMNRINTGSFSVFTGEKPLPDHVIQVLPLFASVLSIIMQRSDFYQANKASYYNHLLTHILNNKEPADKQAYELRLSLLGYSVKKYKKIVAVDLSDEHYSSSQQQAIAKSLQKHIRNSIYVMIDENLVFLSSNDQRTLFDTEDMNTWRKLIVKSNIRIGISDTYEDLTKTRTFLIQAIKAIETGSRISVDQSIFRFDDYRVDDLIANVEDKKVLFSFLYPPLMRVIRYDTRHNTNLAYTLYVFLESPDKPAHACNRLSIHKNTLYYRLGKMREIMKTDFSSAEIIMRIQLTFHILKFQKKFDALVLNKTPTERELP